MHISLKTVKNILSDQECWKYLIVVLDRYYNKDGSLNLGGVYT